MKEAMRPRTLDLHHRNLLGLVRILEFLGVPERIPLEAIARLFKVEIEEGDLPRGAAGVAVPFRDGTWCVALDRTLSIPEREQTLAHELSHAILGVRDEAMAESLGAEVVWRKHFNELMGAVSQAAVKIVEESDCSATLQQILLRFRNLLSLGSDLVDPKKQATAAVIFVLGWSSLVGWGLYVFIKDLIKRRMETRQETNAFPMECMPAAPVATNLLVGIGPLRQRRRSWRRTGRARRATPSRGSMWTPDALKTT